MFKVLLGAEFERRSGYVLVPPLGHQNVIAGIANTVANPVHIPAQVFDQDLLAGTSLSQDPHQQHVVPSLTAVHSELVALHQAHVSEAQAPAVNLICI